jgi:hypothetical protein
MANHAGRSESRSVDVQPHGPELLYLDLLKRSLTGFIREDAGTLPRSEPHPFDPGERGEGRDWPTSAETMIGLRRLSNVQECVTGVLRSGVQGDLIEAGVWRGGATIFMRGVLKAYAVTDRVVWAADSFQGLPEPDTQTYPADEGDELSVFPELAASLEEVRANFERYGLLDDQVRFLPGWFRDTLPEAPIERLSVLRLDGDMYESTIVTLRSLYSKLSSGGYVIVDDYALPRCRAAVDDFRAENRIEDEIKSVDWTGVYWQKSRGASSDISSSTKARSTVA